MLVFIIYYKVKCKIERCLNLTYANNADTIILRDALNLQWEVFATRFWNADKMYVVLYLTLHSLQEEKINL